METMAPPTETKTTQFGHFLAKVIEAWSLVFDKLGTKVCIAAVKNQGERLAIFLELVVTALSSGQNLVLAPPQGESAKPQLLEFVRAYETLPAKRFGVGNFFTTRNSKVKITFINETFQKVFGNKIEENVQPATLRAHRLTVNEFDPWIIVGLGKTSYKSSLAHVASLMEQQPNGEEDGILLNNGRANIFYVPDDNGNLWAVSWAGTTAVGTCRPFDRLPGRLVCWLPGVWLRSFGSCSLEPLNP